MEISQLLPRLTDILRDISEMLRQMLIKELEEQGKRNTGELADSIRYEIQATSKAVVSYFYAKDYWKQQEEGVPASEFEDMLSSNAFLEYVQKLAKYFESMGYGTSEAYRFGINTANKHTEEGMPTEASRRFSTNGRRTGFVSYTLETSAAKLEQAFILKADNEILKTFRNIIEAKISDFA